MLSVGEHTGKIKIAATTTTKNIFNRVQTYAFTAKWFRHFLDPSIPAPLPPPSLFFIPFSLKRLPFPSIANVCVCEQKRFHSSSFSSLYFIMSSIDIFCYTVHLPPWIEANSHVMNLTWYVFCMWESTACHTFHSFVLRNVRVGRCERFMREKGQNLCHGTHALQR